MQLSLDQRPDWLTKERKYWIGLVGLAVASGYWAGNGVTTANSVDHVSLVLGDKLYHTEHVVIPKIKGDAHWQLRHIVQDSEPVVATKPKDCPR